mgnify:CR=1 FL=1
MGCLLRNLLDPQLYPLLHAWNFAEPTWRGVHVNRLYSVQFFQCIDHVLFGLAYEILLFERVAGGRAARGLVGGAPTACPRWWR